MFKRNPFINQYVELILDSFLTTSISSMDKAESKTYPFTVEGFFIREDKDYIYIGKEKGVVSNRFLRSKVLGISKITQDLPAPLSLTASKKDVEVGGVKGGIYINRKSNVSN